MKTSLLTVKQASKKLKVTEARVKQFIDDGRLKAEKFGSVWAIDPDSLSSFQRIKRVTGKHLQQS